MNRRSECEVLDRLVEAVRLSKSQTLVVRGEPGMGKTALLDYLVGRASQCRVVRVAGVQSEMELAFAGLHQLCAPLLDHDRRLPGRQRQALHTALGLGAGSAPDRFLVGLAVLGLLAEVATERPLVCVIDDAQWLDRASAQALAFVARRLVAESVALVFAARDTDEVAELTGLAQLVVAGLPDADARALLGSVLPGPVDPRMLERIVAEARGNPLALVELPPRLTAAEQTGGLESAGGSTVTRHVEDSYRVQLARLDPDTRKLMLLAAAEPLGDPVLLWKAADRLGIGVGAAAPAAAAGLLDIGARVRFQNPLLRSMIYRMASPDERGSAHHALAEVTDPDTDPDRRAWHTAQAAAGPDEDVARDLELSAGRAQARGGLQAAAAFLERAAELTPDPARAAQRALAAAQASQQAGAPDAALRLLAVAEAGPRDELRRAQADLLRAQIAFALNRGGGAPALLLHAAEQLQPLNAKLARQTYLDALSAAMFAGPSATSASRRQAAEAARNAPPPSHRGLAPDLLLDGLARRYTEGYAAGIPMLRRALSAFLGPDLATQDALRWLWLAHVTAVDIWADTNLEALSARHVQLVRDCGALSMLPLALSMRIGAHVLAGDLAFASALTDELEAVTKATGTHIAPYGALLLAAWAGREADAVALIEATREEVVRRGEGIGLMFTEWVQALLYCGLSRYEDALTAARWVTEHPGESGAPTWGALVELIEAATRCGNAKLGTDALRRLTDMTRASGTDWALGVQARSRALLSDSPAAEDLYRQALGRLNRTRIRGELARAHLVYGEWLRRQGRRIDAREQLRTAHDMFTTMGAGAFAQRSARELQATGETARRRTVKTSTELTAQEAQIARLVAGGLSSPETAARLFLSRRTVEWHLSKIYAKLQITSRKQLRKHLG